MLEQIKTKLGEEETQRAILKGVGAVSVFIATAVFRDQAQKFVNLGINTIMEKMHPAMEILTTE